MLHIRSRLDNENNQTHHSSCSGGSFGQGALGPVQALHVLGTLVTRVDKADLVPVGGVIYVSKLAVTK